MAHAGNKPKPPSNKTILRNCKPQGDCLIWTGETDQFGHAEVLNQSTLFHERAARVLYERKFGSIGLTPLTFSCGNARCCNTDHMQEAV